MLAAAVLGIEPLTARKTFGVLIATLGVVVALLTGFSTAPADAWRGDLLMIMAALCQALYSIWSRPFIVRSGTIPYTFVGMTVGAAMLIAVAWSRGGFDVVNDFGPNQWAAIAFLGLFGGALAFYLWTFAGTDDADTRGNYDHAQPADRGRLRRFRLGRTDHMEPRCRFAFGAGGDLARDLPLGGRAD
jgi:drug/metabolite transporter (DMT)-like permease